MVRKANVLGAASLALALAMTSALAQTQTPAANPSLHARAKHSHHHHAAKPKEDTGRQITVHKSTPSWLTLGGGASVGTGNNYVTGTFDQPSPIEGTFSGYRGRERVINQYGVPGTPLFQF